MEDSKCIRLLELLPGTRQDDILCRLRQEELREGLKYEALSYVWGDVRETSPVQVNDLTLAIGKNLRAALLDLRRTGESRLLWADALCIDQSNLDERAKQVQIMGDIYALATRTVVWLGPYYAFVGAAFDCIGRLERETLAQQRAKIPAESASPGTVTSSVSEPSPSKKESEIMRQGYSVLQELAGVSWWSRAWFCKKFSLPQKASSYAADTRQIGIAL